MQSTQFFAEMVGTFIFLLVIINLIFRPVNDAVVISGAIPVYIGIGLIVSIYITTGLGGFGHLNPVVSVVNATNGSITTTEMVYLITAQLIGGLLAYLLWYTMGRKNVD